MEIVLLVTSRTLLRWKKAPEFVNFPADRLKLWNVSIPDDRDDLLSNLTLENNAELLATKKVSKYFPVSPAEEHIHVLVELPASTATSDEVLELRKQLASMQELLNKSVHGMYFFLTWDKRNFRDRAVAENFRSWDSNFTNHVVALQRSTLSLVLNERRVSSGP